MMTKSPVRIIIAVLLVIVLCRNLLGFIPYFSHGVSLDSSSGESIGELVGEALGYGLMVLVIFLLLRDNRKRKTSD